MSMHRNGRAPPDHRRRADRQSVQLCSSSDSATSSRRSTTSSAPRSSRPASNREVGGHIYDRADDGSECRWARVLAYEPPTRVVFSWDIGPYLAARDRSGQRQRSRGPLHRRDADRTRVELEHRNLDRHGPGWEGVRDGIGDEAGWPLYLARYAELVATS